MTSRRCESFPRHVLLALVAAFMYACRAPQAEAPPEAQRTAVEKPWTKETIESHEHLWLELSTKRRGLMTGPVLASDEKGEYLTTKDDPTVHLALSEVVVMDAVEVSAEEEAPEPATFLGVIGGSFAAIWGAVFLFLPAIALYAILA